MSNATFMGLPEEMHDNIFGFTTFKMCIHNNRIREASKLRDENPVEFKLKYGYNGTLRIGFDDGGWYFKNLTSQKVKTSELTVLHNLMYSDFVGYLGNNSERHDIILYCNHKHLVNFMIDSRNMELHHQQFKDDVRDVVQQIIELYLGIDSAEAK